MMSAVASPSPPSSPVVPPQEDRSAAWTVFGVLGLAMLWSFWPAISAMSERWTEAQYSHGFLVPIFAGVILWLRKDMWDGSMEPYWLGLPMLATMAILRAYSAMMSVDALDGIALLLGIAGLVLLVGGKKMFLWSWPGIAFLGFMLPLPYRIEHALAAPLQRWATIASTYVLQTFGFPVLAEGNIIRMGELRLEVLNACNGLGMLMTFFALSTALAMTIQAPPLDRWILVFSAIPIALISNIVRIVATGIAYRLVSKWFGDLIMHDLAGWLMMPLALGIAWLELKLLSKILPIDTDAPSRPRPIGPSLVGHQGTGV
ncbi:MAG: exosortase/archaeosortase family protein [Gemmataceae bacterium]